MSDGGKKVVDRVTSGKVEAIVPSMLYDDIISVLRSKGVSWDDVQKVIQKFPLKIFFTINFHDTKPQLPPLQAPPSLVTKVTM